MEALYKTPNGRLTVKIDGTDDVKAMFEKIGMVMEVFEPMNKCGICKSTVIRPRVRENDGNKYYELVCECGARFEYGQLKKGGGLFPKRRGDDGSRLPNEGWSKWEGNGQSHHGNTNTQTKA
jgi:hypothetical protein